MGDPSATPLLVSPCARHRNFEPQCKDCQGVERESYWARQKVLAKQEKRA